MPTSDAPCTWIRSPHVIVVHWERAVFVPPGPENYASRTYPWESTWQVNLIAHDCRSCWHDWSSSLLSYYISILDCQASFAYRSLVEWVAVRCTAWPQVRGWLELELAREIRRGSTHISTCLFVSSNSTTACGCLFLIKNDALCGDCDLAWFWTCLGGS